MKKLYLPHTDLKVSELCLGTMNYGTWLMKEECIEQIDQFLELGGNFVDTAHVYNDWITGEKSRSEKIIGQWIAGRKRERIVLSTKGGHYDLQKPTVSRVTRDEIRKDLQDSLENLQTDYIDLYFLHRDNINLPVDEILGILNELINEKKIRYIGCSNWTAKRLKEADSYAEKNGLHGFVSNQLMWSLARIQKSAIPPDYVTMDPEFYQYHQKKSLSAMCFSSQAKGYFARKSLGEKLPDDVLSIYENSVNKGIYQNLTALSQTSGHSISELSLHYFTQQPFVSIPIVSCDNIQQLYDCVNAFAFDQETFDYQVSET